MTRKAGIDPERFAQWVQDHHGAVYRSARRWCGEDGAAADLTQDVFVQVWTGKFRIDDAANPRASLCWLAARLACNDRRARRRAVFHQENAMLHRDVGAGDPASLFAEAELHRTVAGLVEALPAELRAPLLMRCQDELSLAAIGSALAVPVSTVHDRVERALRALRAALQQRGVVVADGALLSLLGTADSTAVPTGLHLRLLALRQQALPALGTVHALAKAGLVAVAITGVALAAIGLRRESGPSVVDVAAVAAPVALSAAQDPPPPPLPQPQPSMTQRSEVPLPPAAPVATSTAKVLATFVGTVRDAEAWPVAAAEVAVVASGGLKPFAVGKPTKTDAQGAFRIEVGNEPLAVSTVRIVVREGGRELVHSADLAVPRPAAAGNIDLVLPKDVGSALARYELRVAVRDDAGQPLPKVRVTLYGSDPQPRPDAGRTESHAEADRFGIATLVGRGLGAKWLFVDGRAVHRLSSFAPFAIESAGPLQHEVVLAVGAALTARFTSTDDQALGWTNSRLVDETNGMTHWSEGSEGGSVEFRGLGDGPFTLHVQSSGRSAAAVRSLRPGSAPVEVRLKPLTELREVGDHMAELHGELVDAVTGEVVPFGPFDVDVLQAQVGESTLPFDRVVPPGPAQRMAEGGQRRAFHAGGLTAGRWAIVVGVAGYAKTVQEVELRDGQIAAGLRIALQRPAIVRGRVLDAAGQPVGKAMVLPIGIGALADRKLEQWRRFVPGATDVAAPWPGLTSGAAWTRDDGTFELKGVVPDIALRLVVVHDTGSAVAPLGALRSGEVREPLELRLQAR